MRRPRREDLERHQIPIAFSGLVAGILTGLGYPDLASLWEALVYPTLGLLLYATFLQIPFASLRRAFADRRYLVATLTANFVVVPWVVWSLLHLAPPEPDVRLGMALVLLTPCVDYVIVFTRLGGGNYQAVLASTPALVIVQMLALPIGLWLLLGEAAAQIVEPRPFLEAFAFLIAVPLLCALLAQWSACRSTVGSHLTRFAAWLPVPAMSLTLFFVVGSQISRFGTGFVHLGHVALLYATFHVVMLFLGSAVARSFRLDVERARAITFSAMTRNSLVVLPLALALPVEYSLAALTVVTQTLVELVGLLVAVRIVPRLLPQQAGARGSTAGE